MNLLDENFPGDQALLLCYVRHGGVQFWRQNHPAPQWVAWRQRR